MNVKYWAYYNYFFLHISLTYYRWKVNDRFKNCPRVLHYANGNNVLVDDNEWLVDIIKLYNNAIEFVFPFTRT